MTKCDGWLCHFRMSGDLEYQRGRADIVTWAMVPPSPLRLHVTHHGTLFRA
jgi:hypothetical protein